MLLADSSSKQRTMRFTRRTIVVGTIVALLAISAITIGTSRLIAGFLTRGAMSSVLEENRTLHLQIGGLTERLDRVQQDMKSLAISDDQLRLLADMPRLDVDVRAVGVGGAVAPDAGLDATNPDVGYLVPNLDKLEREILLQRDSYAKIENRMKERQDLIGHTPSIRPIDKGYYSSGFGIRKDPFNGRRAHHNGLDISVERGTPVMATAAGSIIFAKATPGLGKLIVIDHGYGFRTAYGHLSSIHVNKGQLIKRGQKIGLTGATGRSTAPHLHYEVHVNGHAVDPYDFFLDGTEDIAALK